MSLHTLQRCAAVVGATVLAMHDRWSAPLAATTGRGLGTTVSVRRFVAMGTSESFVAMGPPSHRAALGGPRASLADDPLRAVIEADAENAFGPSGDAPTPYSWYGYPVPVFGTGVRCLSRRQTRCNAPDPVHLDGRTRVQNRRSAHVLILNDMAGTR